MRRAIMVLLVLGLLAFPMPAVAAVPGLVTFYMGPQLLAGRVQTQTVDGVLLVPARTLADALGASYKVGAESGTATITGRETVHLRVGESAAKVGDKLVSTGVPMAKVGGLVAAPLEFLAGVLGYRAEVVGDKVLLTPQPDPGLAKEIVIEKAYRQSLRFSVSLDGEGWTVISGTITPPGEVQEIGLCNQSGGYVMERLLAVADVRNGEFRMRVRLEKGKTHEVQLSQSGDEAGFFAATWLAKFSVTVPADTVVTALKPVNGLVIESPRLVSDLLEVKASALPGGDLALEGAIKPEAGWKQVQIESMNSRFGFTVTAAVSGNRFRTVLPLPGPERHILKISIPDQADAKKSLTVAYLTVEQTATTTRRPITYVPGSPIALTAPSAGGLTYADKVTLTGTVADMAQGHILASVIGVDEKGKEVYSFSALAVKDGRFSGEIWLRFGPGRQVIVLMTLSGDGAVTTWVQLTVENTGKSDLRYLAPSLRMESDDPEVAGLAKRVAGSVSSPLDKIRAVHDWVAGSIAWDLNRKYDPFRDGALRTIRAKSGGPRDYAELSVALLRAAGVEAVVADGNVRLNGEWYRHYWVEAKAGDRWVSLDPFLDAGEVRNGWFFPELSLGRFDMAPDYLKANYFAARYQY